MSDLFIYGFYYIYDILNMYRENIGGKVNNGSGKKRFI